MSKTEMIRARMEPDLKARAETILHELGLSATDAITVFYRQIVLHGGLPFGVLIPNELTQKTLRDSLAGKGLVHFKDEGDFFDTLRKDRLRVSSHHHESFPQGSEADG